MAETARSIAKKAGTGAMQRAFEAIVPELFQRLDRIDDRIAALDRDVHALREEMSSRFEQARDVMNELGQRLSRVEGQIDLIVTSVNRQSDKMDQWIERLVRIEMTRDSRKGKRAS
jgi:chromosome segregation ATPase